MGRFWIGVFLLAIFLALGLWVGSAMESAHTDIAEQLEQAAQQTARGDFQEGIRLAQQAEADWEKCRNAAAAVADHTPMEEIDSLFAQLQIFQQIREETGFAAGCARLSKLVSAVGQAHKATLWNLL